MTLRHLRIGARLGLGFGALVVAAVALLALVMISQHRSAAELAASLDRTNERAAATTAMKTALLESAIAIRNMGLESELVTVQKHQVVAESLRKVFVDGIETLKAHASKDAEQQAAAELTGIDAKMNAAFKEAVGLYVSFGTEEASKIITTQIDPLLGQAKQRMERVIQIQHQEGLDARERSVAQASETLRLLLVSGAAVLAAAVVLAWRIAASITRPLATALQATSEVAAGNLRIDIDAGGSDEAAQLMAGLRRMRDSLARMVSKVRTGADSIALASNEIAQGNADLSARTETQASALNRPGFQGGSFD